MHHRQMRPTPVLLAFAPLMDGGAAINRRSLLHVNGTADHFVCRSLFFLINSSRSSTIIGRNTISSPAISLNVSSIIFRSIVAVGTAGGCLKYDAL